MVKIKVENGYYIFKLDDILKQRNISINKLIRDTDTDFKVIKRFMCGNSIKLDLYVLARFCDYLNCSITDLLEYKK